SSCVVGSSLVFPISILYADWHGIFHAEFGAGFAHWFGDVGDWRLRVGRGERERRSGGLPGGVRAWDESDRHGSDLWVWTSGRNHRKGDAAAWTSRGFLPCHESRAGVDGQ